jgi:hypothetical protein
LRRKILETTGVHLNKRGEKASACTCGNEAKDCIFDELNNIIEKEQSKSPLKALKWENMLDRLEADEPPSLNDLQIQGLHIEHKPITPPVNSPSFEVRMPSSTASSRG